MHACIFIYFTRCVPLCFSQRIFYVQLLCYFFSSLCSSFSSCFYIIVFLYIFPWQTTILLPPLTITKPSRKFLSLTLLVVVLLLLGFYCTFLRFTWMTDCKCVTVSFPLPLLTNLNPMCFWSEKILKRKKSCHFVRFLYYYAVVWCSVSVKLFEVLSLILLPSSSSHTQTPIATIMPSHDFFPYVYDFRY